MITAVAGAPVRTFDDLRMAFADVAPGAILAVTVMRDGKPLPVQLRLGGDRSMLRSQILSVSADVASTVDPLARAIRQSIFGPGLGSGSANDGASQQH